MIFSIAWFLSGGKPETFHQSHNMEITAAEFRQLCQESGFMELPIDYRHILGLDNLFPKEGMPVHKDPFDKLLLSQAIVENAMFMTHDSKINTFDTLNLILA